MLRDTAVIYNILLFTNRLSRVQPRKGPSRTGKLTILLLTYLYKTLMYASIVYSIKSNILLSLE